MLAFSEELHLDVFHDVESKVQHHEYTSFGVLASITDANGNDISTNPKLDQYFTYTGREYDKESGLYYYRARMYDPSIGRFIQNDPDPGGKQVPQSVVNKYIYAANSPAMYGDRSGKLHPLLIILAVAVTAAALEACLREISGHKNGKSWGATFSQAALKNFIVAAAFYYAGPANPGMTFASELSNVALIQSGLLAFEGATGVDPRKKVAAEYNRSKDKKGLGLFLGVTYLASSSVMGGQAASWLENLLPEQAANEY